VGYSDVLNILDTQVYLNTYGGDFSASFSPLNE